MLSQDLQQSFQKTYTYFNNLRQGGNNYNDLVEMLHVDVVMKKVDDGKLELRGQQVKDYFGMVVNGNRKDAQLDPVGPNYCTYGNIGLVWGSAFWQDRSTMPKPTAPNLAYSFAYEQDSNGYWLILLLWGAEMDAVATPLP